MPGLETAWRNSGIGVFGLFDLDPILRQEFATFLLDVFGLIANFLTQLESFVFQQLARFFATLGGENQCHQGSDNATHQQSAHERSTVIALTHDFLLRKIDLKILYADTTLMAVPTILGIRPLSRPEAPAGNTLTAISADAVSFVSCLASWSKCCSETWVDCISLTASDFRSSACFRTSPIVAEKLFENSPSLRPRTRTAMAAEIMPRTITMSSTQIAFMFTGIWPPPESVSRTCRESRGRIASPNIYSKSHRCLTDKSTPIQVTEEEPWKRVSRGEMRRWDPREATASRHERAARTISPYTSEREVEDPGRVVDLTHLNRSSARRTLRAKGAQGKGPVHRLRASVYKGAVLPALTEFWHLSDRLCGKRLVPFLRRIIPSP